MTDATTKAIAETLRRWNEAPSAQIIDFYEARARIMQRKAVKRWRRPTHPTGPRAA